MKLFEKFFARRADSHDEGDADSSAPGMPEIPLVKPGLEEIPIPSRDKRKEYDPVGVQRNIGEIMQRDKEDEKHARDVEKIHEAEWIKKERGQLQ